MTSYTLNDACAALSCSRSTLYRMRSRGKIKIADTPVGPRVASAEVERLLGGNPIHIAHDPNPKRQAAAAHARAAKRDMAELTEELRAFMAEVRETLARIEARTTISKTNGAAEVGGPDRTPIGSRW